MQRNLTLGFTGERFVPEISGDIELEHMHRYIYALAYAGEKTILDIASGEGYGAALLAKRAKFVFGVDIAENAVSHSQQKYQLPNLEFRIGSCSNIPLPDSAVDLVVSFETIEHHDEHEQMLAEIKRVLRPDGMVIVSSPDKAIYTDKPDYHNPFHVKELYRGEFEALFTNNFKNVASLGQKVMFGSGIIPNDEGPQAVVCSVDLSSATSRPGLAAALYNLVLASEVALPALPASLLDVGIDASETVKHWKATVAQRDDDIKRWQATAAQCDDDIKHWQATVAQRDDDIKRWQATAAQRDGDIRRLQSELDENRTKVQRLEGELQAVWNQVALSTEHTHSLIEDSKHFDSDLATISLSPFFDAVWYLNQYPDVANSEIEPARHYADFGRIERRQPSPLFDAPWYLDQNPDVFNAAMNPLLHYMKHGRAEGRAIRVPASGRILTVPMSNGKTTLVSEPKLNKKTKILALIPANLPFPTNKLSPDRDCVVVIVHEASRTGAPILAWNIIGELQKSYNVVALLRRGGPIEQAFGDVAAATISLPNDFPMLSEAVEAVIDRLIEVYSPIYVIANSVEARYFVPGLEKMGLPVVALVHEFSSSVQPLGSLNALFETASCIVFSAQTTADAATKDYKWFKARDFRVLPQGPSALPRNTGSRISDASAGATGKALERTMGDGSIRVIGVGTITIRKGVDFFISTAATVRRALPDQCVQFVWVGKCYSFDQPYLEFLKEQIERSGLTDSFILLEEVEDLKPIYDQADILFLSSRLDPMPNVAIDSSLNGIPVVCFDKASGMAEILSEDADTRELVVPYLDSGAAAALICDLARDPVRLARLSQAVRKLAETRFDMARYVEAIDGLGRNAIMVLRQIKLDHALISTNSAFNAELYTGKSRDTLNAEEGLSSYLNASRQVAPRSRPRTGLLLRRPSEGFHPLVYASDNSLFDEASGEDPLAHYVRTGRPEGRWCHQVLRPRVGQKSAESRLNVAVHGHFHYPELFPEFIKRLKRNAATADLYLTTTSAAKAAELAKLSAASHLMPQKIAVVVNRGRDIGSMLTELGESVFSGYDVVGHFHGKRSLHTDEQVGDRWRTFLWEHLIGGDFAMMDLVLAALAEDESLGLIFAEEPHLNDWDDNRALAEKLAGRMGLAMPLPNHFDFPMGTMFWARSAALKPLLDLGLTWEDYPEEPLPIDGTILHAIERLLPFSAEKAGYRYATTYVKNWTR